MKKPENIYYSTALDKHTAVIVHVKNFTPEEKDAIMKYTINYAKTSTTWKPDHNNITKKEGDVLNDQPTKLDLAMKAKSSQSANTIPQEAITVTDIEESPKIAKMAAKKSHT